MQDGCANVLAVGEIGAQNSFCLQDRDAGPGADGRRWEDHDAKRRDVWHLHGHRDGNPLLRKTTASSSSLRLYSLGTQITTCSKPTI